MLVLIKQTRSGRHVSGGLYRWSEPRRVAGRYSSGY